jgi:hypothetical protein
MNRKVITLLVIAMFIATSSTTVAVGSIEFINQSSTDYYESTTISEFAEIIKDELYRTRLNSRIEMFFTKCIEKGIEELEEIGIIERNLEETEDILTKGFFNRKTRYRSILINYNPDEVNIYTTIPPFVRNISDNETENRTLEIFIKLIPIFDIIETEQRIFIRKLYQSTSLLWPAIGGRIIEDNSTKFILAFGAAIHWYWRLF